MASSERSKPVEKALTILANVAVVLGVPMFFYQQHLSNTADAEKATLSYVTRFQDDDFIKAQLVLFDEWSAFPIGALHADVDAARDFVGKDIATRRQNRDPSIDDALFRFEAFFAELAQCIGKAICSRGVSETYFRDFARRLICLYGPQFDEVQRTLGVKGFGDGVRKIAGDAGCEGGAP
jgi:hypothetical protein